MPALRRIPPAALYLLLNAATAFTFAVMFTSTMLYYITVIRLDPFQLVLVGTALEVAIFLFEIPTGIVADLYSRRLSIIIGKIVIGLGYVQMVLIPTAAAVYIGQIIWGFGYTFTSGATDAWIADEIGEERAAGLYLRSSQFGAAAGIAGIVVGIILGSLQLVLPIFVGAILSILLGIFLALSMTENGYTPKPRTGRGLFAPLTNMRGTLRDGVLAVRARPVLITILLITVVHGAFSEGFDRLWQKHIIDTVGFPETPTLQPVAWFGLHAIAASLIGIGAAEWTRRRVNTAHHRAVARALLITSGFLSAAVIGFAFVGNWWAAALITLAISALRTVHDPLTTAWINQSLDSNSRATVLSMNGQADAFGEMAVGPGVGAFAARFSVRAALVLAGFLLLPALGLYGRSLQEGQEGQSQKTGNAL